MVGNSDFIFKRGKGTTLLIGCGALGREIIDLIKVNKWEHLDVTCLPAKLHHNPQLIPEAVREKIRTAGDCYEKIYVLYGDCGTGGLLDKVLEEEGDIERIAGPHCFSFFMGNDTFSNSAEDEITTFFLTDYFCRFFDKFVWEALGLDRHEDMLDMVFGNYTKLLFMPQVKDPELEIKAQEIASRLKLKYEYRFCGYGDFETSIKSLKQR
ncbi:DUF1638 domain-containing protein [Kiloniella antarctica]|uniref:DUF1638 domain-containing protein n=1 Tax=Kiloniella antarctica TaxID=1550907 RepID=A0ABW5BM70_9PROT